MHSRCHFYRMVIKWSAGHCWPTWGAATEFFWSAHANKHIEWPAKAHPAPTSSLSPGNIQSFLSDTGWSLGVPHFDSVSFSWSLWVSSTLYLLSFPSLVVGGGTEKPCFDPAFVNTMSRTLHCFPSPQGPRLTNLKSKTWPFCQSSPQKSPKIVSNVTPPNIRPLRVNSLLIFTSVLWIIYSFQDRW